MSEDAILVSDHEITGSYFSNFYGLQKYYIVDRQ